jgi:hypothetical protein
MRYGPGAQPGDIVVDMDAIAVALGSTD